FSFDITNHIKKKNGAQTIVLSVTDPTDKESISRGKQQLDQFGIWYTPVSGIWQTVWLEAVHPTHIRKLLPEADMTNRSITLNFDYANIKGGEQLTIKLTDQDKIIASVTQPVAGKITIKVPNPVLWTAETPKLYGLEIELIKNKAVIDRVESYFAMREVSSQKDENGYNRIFLNNKPIFQYGTLDQGWWPDGLLTPPSAEAMLWDMVQLKNMGFNTIRKHIKVEPALYYYYADSLGLMLWQDMPSGFATARKETEHIRPVDKEDWKAPEEVVSQWKREINEMIDELRFFPSITTWVVFNEGWGQHNTPEMVQLVQQKDPKRITNGVSGWTDRNVGNMLDIHNYPLTSMVKPVYNNDRISALGEFGGLGLPVENHLWNPEMRNWGYKNFDGSATFINDYAHLVFDLETLIAQGLSAAIYTQTTDVEGEVNGLISYDRKVIKIPATLLHAIHSRLYKVPSMKAVTLIADGQVEKQSRTITLNGTSLKVQTPHEIKGEAQVVCKEKFTVDKMYQNLSLWLNVNGSTKILINGVPVFDQPVKNTRQYNQINLSDYSYLLQTGENTFEIEVKTTAKDNGKIMNFDFGLTAF
ncbi:MAG: beta-galactosidase, partial [Dysgonamonadaceae bacterium]|nr:beta-galactosidase [Dysgonamonadaceae bacterium]